MIDDPIVAEIRRVRDAHMQKFNFDLHAIFRDLKEQQRASGRRFISFPPRPYMPIGPTADVPVK
ncbi:MAG: hypothetical protein EXS05_20015 [Planctomycetaceae bacterium]|nr:hypothetical protein [Planctomycetaceae bacterium]